MAMDPIGIRDITTCSPTVSLPASRWVTSDVCRSPVCHPEYETSIQQGSGRATITDTALR